MGSEGELLSGGNMGEVHRVGDEVRRTAGPWTPTIHRLLTHLADRGIGEAPRPLGLSDDGRERLTFLPGTAPAYPMPAWVWAERLLVDAGRLLRRIHDASAGFDRTGAIWRSPSREPAEVVCHNDFAQYNLIFTDDDHHRLSGVIDFDFASPGPRLWDLAYLAYRLVPITGEEQHPFGDAEVRHRVRALLDAYGSPATEAELRSMIIERLAHLAAFSDAQAIALGKPELAEHAAQYRRDADRLGG
ncbi:Ser/Thr protein kinase RdoA (MazF antagonist) [Naumannella cuiyingiana]|uniref:Ser/Thr protein kinase RdoA (MazF antagonist) n=1 Tax=Naumannella cuiyingiana TaxID=1347891 RepID=A0A7Z0D848_9ACTN|nr:aminoglycoside phosphotransferase family protein [Naumannella cuiyingiana]NYI70691.1 Ser/Thr protein kinase RdoA (MazF antagonist) [Naumannella cuiyingiana]